MYSYYDLLNDVNYLAHFGVECGNIGSSVSGKLIPYVHVGKSSGKQIIISGAIHAREHVTALLTVKQIYAFLNNTPDVDGGVYFVPMINPDGNLLCYSGVKEFESQKAELIRLNGGSEDFRLWKSNLNGVDLNCNFDARWGTGKQNVFKAGGSDFVGTHANSEVETKALISFTKRVSPCCTVSYHALGQQIYWKFYQDDELLKRDRNFAKYVNSFINYELINGTLGSAGGYKDWCVSKLNIPALTIEVVNSKFSHPLSDNAITDDIEPNKFLPQRILEYFSNV